MTKSSDLPIKINIGYEHIIIQKRYEVAGALNDLLIAVWFLIGSIFFLYEDLITDGTWLFIAGSFQLLIKAVIKCSSLIHINKLKTPRKKSKIIV